MRNCRQLSRRIKSNTLNKQKKIERNSAPWSGKRSTGGWRAREEAESEVRDVGFKSENRVAV